MPRTGLLVCCVFAATLLTLLLGAVPVDDHVPDARNVARAQVEEHVLFMPVMLVRLDVDELPLPATALPVPTDAATPTVNTLMTATPSATRTGRQTATPTPTHSPTGPPSATSTMTPAATSQLDDPYFFLEVWENLHRGPGCGRMYVDFPTYSFNRDTGRMFVQLWGGNSQLESDDFGYYGCGTRVTGQGSGIGSSLQNLREVPFTWCRIELRDLTETGDVTVVRESQVIDIAAGEEWAASWESEDGPGCIVTTTYRITNFGLQDRGKIEYQQ